MIPELFYNELETIHLVNLERRKAGLAPLRWNQELTLSARWFAADAVESNPGGYCGHTDSLGRGPGQRMTDFGYLHLSGWAENAVCGYALPAAIVRAWMASDLHRTNLLKPGIRETGIGYYYNKSTGRGYVVQDLTSDHEFAPVIVEDEAPNTTTPNVRLYLYDQDTGGGFAGVGKTVEIMVANEPTFQNAAWQPYQVEVDWTLEAGEGWRTVYVKARDALGRTTLVHDTIYLGETVPLDQLTLDHASDYKKAVELDGLPTDNYEQIALALNWVGDQSDPTLDVVFGTSEVIADPEAVGGASLRMRADGRDTYVSLYSAKLSPDNPLTAYFRLKTSDNSSAEEVVQLLVGDGSKTLAKLSVRGTDFTSSDQYQEFSIPFTFPSTSGSYLTVELFRAGPADIYFDVVRFYTAPTSLEMPFAWETPDSYYRSSGVQARLIAPDGTVSEPVEAMPYVGTPITTIAPTPQPQIELFAAPTSVVLMADDASTPPGTQAIDVGCVGCSGDGWEATAEQSWMVLTPEADRLLVGATLENLASGIYNGQIEVRTNAAPDLSPVSIDVTLYVGNAEELLTERVFLPVTLR